MKAALDELGVGPSGPDRLADPTQSVGGAGGVHELLPRRDDASGVAADDAHVGERDVVGVGAEPGSQHFDAAFLDEDESGLVRGYGLAEEGEGRRDELVVTGIEEGLVTKPRSRVNGTFCHAQHDLERTPACAG